MSGSDSSSEDIYRPKLSRIFVKNTTWFDERLHIAATLAKICEEDKESSVTIGEIVMTEHRIFKDFLWNLDIMLKDECYVRNPDSMKSFIKGIKVRAS